MGLLDGDIAAIFRSVMGEFYLDATLHRGTVTDDGMGGGSFGFADEAVKAQLDSTTQEQQADGGFTDQDQRILVLADGVAAPSVDDEITVRGVRWAIQSVGVDPAAAYYDLRGRRA